MYCCVTCLYQSDIDIVLKKIGHEQSGGQIVLFVRFVALRPKSTAMVIAGRSVHLNTLFPGRA